MNPHIGQYFMSTWGCQNPLSCPVFLGHVPVHDCRWWQCFKKERNRLGQDWYIGSVKDSQPPKKLLHFSTRFPALPCLALLCWFAVFSTLCTSPLSQQHGAVEKPWLLEQLLERFLLPHLFSRPSSAPSLASETIFLHYPWLRQPKQFLQQYWCLRWIPHYLSPPVLNDFLPKS